MASSLDVLKYPVDRKLSPNFPWNLQLVVAGVPRGGTQYLTNCLRPALMSQLTAGHEALFCYNFVRDYGDRQAHDVEVTGFAWPYLDSLVARGIPIFHLLRHPVPACNSILKFFPESFPVPERDWPAAVELWYQWHRRTSEKALYWFRLEDQTEDAVEDILKILGVDVPREEIERCCSKASRGNSTAGDLITWDHLPPVVQDFAYERGYSEHVQTPHQGS